ncbi:MAG: hypothetical protein AUK24_02605 [Syntrophaceae bacterium CG2_30_49_12]|nr:MAG: hypothetical protein AUK24_02605 [Syntrophaceae bacterium CG2_30_49_12]PIP06407.1 MAG: hypothetical protein COX52_07360 [Syntrophobacterales bacterium CG23_combo_of_CG06-09_8_20_14_all_48_27]PJA50445.1 MAG: hypothetical protein CO171_01615 [Syntrophobacterales bacterium CG_4_9_14_3_um_filter_49_8]PJC73364.1 MAG: hypothetical protein CO012_09415 [Syntrophobacterales bacterium CG_4_8_14_3_um_filter_49_14]
MRELSRKLTFIQKDADETLLREAKDIIIELRRVNQRWNIRELDEFLNQRQRELKIGYGTR